MNLPKIIGLSGTNGSGKDTIGEMLAERHGYLFVSVADLLRDEAKRRSLPIEREVLRTISAEWRRAHGVGVLVDRAMEQYEQAKDRYHGIVISPMRNPGEAARLQEVGGLLVWVDADPRVRYERVSARARSAEDKKTYEQFLAEEKAEMHPAPSADEATLNMSAVKAKADIFLQNDDSDIEAFKDAAEKTLSL